LNSVSDRGSVEPKARSPKRRTRRTDRRLPSNGLRLTPRDLELLQATGRLRFATTAQLARLVFNGSVWAARKRLRRLLDAGLIRCWVPRLEAPNIYALAPGGARVLGADTDGESWPAPRGLDRRLEHLLAVNSLRVALAATLDAESAQIDWWRSDMELAGRGANRAVPDGLFRVSWPDGPQTFALEVDRTPPAPEAFVRRLVRYERGGILAFGVQDFSLLIVGSTPGWVNRARQHAARLRLTQRISFSTFEEVARAGAKAVWVALSGELQPSLRRVASVKTGLGPEGGDLATAAAAPRTRDSVL
jgi:hypothetical protein